MKRHLPVQGLMYHHSHIALVAGVFEFEDLRIGRYAPGTMHYFVVNTGPWMFMQYLN